MDFNAFKDWALLALLSGGVFILWQSKEVGKEVKDDLKELKNGVNALNTKIAVTIERMDGHEKRIEKVEDDIVLIKQ